MTWRQQENPGLALVRDADRELTQPVYRAYHARGRWFTELKICPFAAWRDAGRPVSTKLLPAGLSRACSQGASGSRTQQATSLNRQSSFCHGTAMPPSSLGLTQPVRHARCAILPDRQTCAPPI
jgi:hypothetical protein